MSDLPEMTPAHVTAINVAAKADGEWLRPDEQLRIREILSLVRGLADGSLRCADSTKVIVEREDAEITLEAAYQVHLEAGFTDGSTWEVWDALRRWLSTPEQPAPTEESK